MVRDFCMFETLFDGDAHPAVGEGISSAGVDVTEVLIRSPSHHEIAYRVYIIPIQSLLGSR